MNYFEVWKSVWQKYVVFQGRAGRREFWTFGLINLAVYIIIWALMLALRGSGLDRILIIIYWLFALALILPSLAVTVRRLHDSGKSGWWILIAIIPIIGAIVLLVFELLDSQPGDNKYGPNPKGMAGPAMPPPAAPASETPPAAPMQ